MARIETTDLDLALAAARAERDLAAAELKLRLAGARKEEIAELSAQARAAEAEAEGAERDLARMQALLERGSGTEKGRDDARVRRDVAAGRLQAAREALNRARAGSRSEEIAAARARVDAAEARMAELDQKIADATVTAPVAGIVSSKAADPGELLAAGATLFVVTDLAHPWLTAWIGEPDLARVRIGQAAVVRTDDGRTREGTVRFIASTAEFTPKNVQTREERVTLVFRIKIGLENTDGLFKPGMPAEAKLVEDSAAHEARR